MSPIHGPLRDTHRPLGAAGKFLGDSPLQILVSHHKEHAYVVLTGELDGATAPFLVRTLVEVNETVEGDLVLDIKKLSFIDSTGLSVFVSQHKILSAKGGSRDLRTDSDGTSTVPDHRTRRDARDSSPSATNPKANSRRSDSSHRHGPARPEPSALPVLHYSLHHDDGVALRSRSASGHELPRVGTQIQRTAHRTAIWAVRASCSPGTRLSHPGG